MKILIIDNYDSFTYNLYQYLKEISSHHIEVRRNDQIPLDEINGYDALVFSPGTGLPKDAGNMPSILEKYHNALPILGVCLGHQAIGELYGAQLENMDRVYHGVDTGLKILDGQGLFQGISQGTRVGRYHSWTIRKDSLPDELIVTAVDEAGEIMAVRHKSDPVYGVQFHPESILTPEGKPILRNFLRIAENMYKQ